MSRFTRVKWTTQWLKLGIAGDTGTGKTLSSIRLALGIAAELGGRVAMLDMDASRSAEYHDHDFDVEHMKPPFTSARISEAIKDAVRDGYTVMILDGMEKEHQNMTDWQLEVWDEKYAAACQKAKNQSKHEPNRASFSRIAWGVVKPPRKELIATIEDAPIHLILTFAAEEKQDENFRARGWIPTGGKKVLKTLKWLALLKPGANGRPSWKPDKDERDIVKSPGYLHPEPAVLSEDVGRRFAKWARGDHLEESADRIGQLASNIVHRLGLARSAAGLDALGPEIEGQWGTLTPVERDAINAAAARAREAITEGSK